MSQKKKNVSCLGLFLKSFIFSAFFFILTVGGTALIAVKGFGSDPALWSDFSSWSSRGWLSVYFVTLMSGASAFAISIMGAALISMLGRGGKSSTAKKRSRPQSARRTTI